MLYRQKKDTYIRNYDSIGYITSTGIWNDRIVNRGGAVFLSALNREGQTLEQLAEKILPQFVGVDRDTIISDAKEFYDDLVIDGFLVSGETEEELNEGRKLAPAKEATGIRDKFARAAVCNIHFYSHFYNLFFISFHFL